MGEKEAGDKLKGSPAEREELIRLSKIESTFQDELARSYGEASNPRVELRINEADSAESVISKRIEKLGAEGKSHQRYILKGEVGRGGMGAVLRIFDGDLRRNLAMKVVLGRGDQARGDTPQIEAQQILRFIEEAQVTGQLDHPGVVPVHELGVDAEGRVYFTMQLVKGEDLSKVFKKVHDGDPEWNQTRVLGVLLKVCEAMSYAHEKGVVHRDLKPANVMVGRHGAVYVMDWGLARVEGREGSHDVRLQDQPDPLSEFRTDKRDVAQRDDDSPLMTRDGAILGTVFYMPPEQASGRLEEIGPHSDVYAVGAMLYHLLTGRMPYHTPGDRTTALMIVARLLHGPPKPVHELAPNVSPELVAICEKAMARELQDRYANMAELAEDLRAFLEQRVVRAYRTGAVVEFKKWVQRNRALAGTVIAAIGGLVAALIVIIVLWTVSDQRGKKLQTSLARETELRMAADKERNRALASEKLAERRTYSANLYAAKNAFQRNEYRRARRRLEECSPETRDWVWNQLFLSLDQSLQTFGGEKTGSVDSLVWSESPNLITSISDGYQRRIWDIETGECLQLKEGSSPNFFANAHWNSSGTHFASYGVRGDGKKVSLEIWDADSHQVSRVLYEGTDPPEFLAWDPTGTRNVMVHHDRHLECWDTFQGEREWSMSMTVSGVSSVAGNRGGTRIALGFANGIIQVWDAKSGEILKNLHGHKDRVLEVVWNKAGTQLLSGSEDKTLRIWDVDSGKSLRTLRGHLRSVNSADWSPAGNRIVSGSADATLRIWDADTGRSLQTLVGHDYGVYSVAWGASGKRIASGDNGGYVHIWDADTGGDVQFLKGHTNTVTTTSWNPAGTQILSGSWDQSIRIWDAESGNALLTHKMEESINGLVAWNSECNRIVSGSENNTLRIWDTETWELLLTLEGHKREVWSAAWSADGKRIASGSNDNSIRTWEAATGEGLLVLRGHEGGVDTVAWNQDGSRIVSGSHDNTLRIWNAETGECLATLTGHKGEVNSASWNPAGTRIASASQDHTVRIWDAETGIILRTMTGHFSDVESVAWSPPDRRIVSGSRNGTLRIWDTDTGECLQILKNHHGAVLSVAWNSSGTRILSGSADRTVGIWESRLEEALPMWRAAAQRE